MQILKNFFTFYELSGHRRLQEHMFHQNKVMNKYRGGDLGSPNQCPTEEQRDGVALARCQLCTQWGWSRRQGSRDDWRRQDEAGRLPHGSEHIEMVFILLVEKEKWVRNRWETKQMRREKKAIHLLTARKTNTGDNIVILERTKTKNIQPGSSVKNFT